MGDGASKEEEVLLAIALGLVGLRLLVTA